MIWGIKQWDKNYNSGVSSDIIQTSDSGYLLVGGGLKAAVLRINQYGDSIWEKQYGTSFNDTFTRIKKANENEKYERLKESYLDRVVIGNGCWGWKGYVDKNGYAQINGHNGKRHVPIKAHRVSYMIYKGQIEKGKIICHTCDNPSCTNPDHLWMGTPKENTADMMRKNRGRKAHGL